MDSKFNQPVVFERYLMNRKSDLVFPLCFCSIERLSAFVILFETALISFESKFSFCSAKRRWQICIKFQTTG